MAIWKCSGETNRGKVLRRSEGWPIDRFAVIERVWANETVLCLGGGPSASASLAELCRGKVKTLAVNDAYLLAPWAEVCYFADLRWWEWNKNKKEFLEFAGQRCTISNTGMLIRDESVYMLRNGGNEKLSEQSNTLNTGSNGGYQVVNFAALTGAKRILLLGYDMRFTGGKSHWHKGHPIKVPEQTYSIYARKFNSMLPQLKSLGVEVINCTPGSAINCFPFSTIEEEMKR